MKPTSYRFRFLTPAVAAAVLALPVSVLAEDPPAQTEPAQPRQEQAQQVEPQREPTRIEIPTPQYQQGERAGDPARIERTTEDLGRATDVDLNPQNRLAPTSDITPDAKPQADAKPISHWKSDSNLGAIQKASDVMGRTVVDTAGAEIGEVEDLIVDLDTGKIVAAIIDADRVAGLGSDYHAVPTSALSRRSVNELSLDATKLRSTPKVNLSQWRQNLNHSTLASLYQSYGDEFHSDAFLARAADKQNSSATRAFQVERESDLGADQQRVRGAAEPVGDDSAPQSERDNWGPAHGDALRAGSGTESNLDASGHPSSGEMNLARASQLIGEDVMNDAGVELGEIKDLGVDLENGRVVTAAVGSGGFLGIGGECRMIPATALKTDSMSESVQLRSAAQQFEQAPRFSPRSWPVQNHAYVGKLYRDFGMDPYFESNSSLPQGSPSSPSQLRQDFLESSPVTPPQDVDRNQGTPNQESDSAPQRTPEN